MTTPQDWNQLVNELSSHPYIEVIEIFFNSPVQDNLIEAIEDEYKFQLPSPVKDFYKMFNGLKVEWILNIDCIPSSIREQVLEYDYFTDIVGSVGLINIISIEECFLGGQYIEPIFSDSDLNDEIQFKGITWQERDMIRQLKPFDIFDVLYGGDCMSFFIDPIHNEIDVLLLTNHFAGWNYSRLTDFNSYLKFLLVTKGIIRARSVVFEEDEGDTMENYMFTNEEAIKFIPKLFQT
jgi:hypothetical protein